MLIKVYLCCINVHPILQYFYIYYCTVNVLYMYKFNYKTSTFLLKICLLQQLNTNGELDATTVSNRSALNTTLTSLRMFFSVRKHSKLVCRLQVTTVLF